MANIKPPLRAEDKKKVIVPIEAVTQIPPSKKITPLQLTGVPETVKVEYKVYAAGQSQAMGALFVEMFEFYQQHHK